MMLGFGASRGARSHNGGYMKLLATILLVIGFANPARAQILKGKDVALSFKASYADRYFFRGHQFSEEGVVTADLGLGIANWSYDFYTEPNEAQIEREYNHRISFTSLSRIGIMTVGYLFYDYEGHQPDTQELFVRVKRESRWNPTSGISYDFDTYRGFYLDYALTRFFPLSRKSQFYFSLRGGLAYDMTEIQDSDLATLEPGFFGKDGITHYSAHLNYLIFFQRRFKFETGVSYYRAEDEQLHRSESIDESETLWQTSITLTLP